MLGFRIESTKQSSISAVVEVSFKKITCYYHASNLGLDPRFKNYRKKKRLWL